jgi:CRP-like cAMP-binding protein
MDIGVAPGSAAAIGAQSGDPCAAVGLAAKLSRYLTLTGPERACIAGLAATTQLVARRRDLVREGHECATAYLLCSGVVSRYRVLPDGRRQVLNFGLSGDLVGFPSCLFPRATASVCCITDVLVAPLPLEQVSALFTRFPRLGTALFWAAAREAAIGAERLVAVGRRGADERVAYFFLELFALQAEAPLRDGDRFTFPVTQELIADAIGLSTPHVNRTLRKLRQRRLLALDGQEAVVLDARGLIMTASFDPAHFVPRPIPGGLSL